MRIIAFLFATLFVLSACGVDPIKNGATSSNAVVSVAGVNGTQCSCNAIPMFVCGADGITYDNSCIAKCKGSTQWTQGHCQCDPTLKVCGADGFTYNECDAIQFRIQITKFTACNVQPL